MAISSSSIPSSGALSAVGIGGSALHQPEEKVPPKLLGFPASTSSEMSGSIMPTSSSCKRSSITETTSGWLAEMSKCSVGSAVKLNSWTCTKMHALKSDSCSILSKVCQGTDALQTLLFLSAVLFLEEYMMQNLNGEWYQEFPYNRSCNIQMSCTKAAEDTCFHRKKIESKHQLLDMQFSTEWVETLRNSPFWHPHDQSSHQNYVGLYHLHLQGWAHLLVESNHLGTHQCHESVSSHRFLMGTVLHSPDMPSVSWLHFTWWLLQLFFPHFFQG